MTHQHVRWLSISSFIVALGVVLALVVAWLNVRGDEIHERGVEAETRVTSQLVERGAYLARAGNCAGCHTTRGGQPYAGTLAIATPFGTVFTSNLTPDAVTGLGSWSSADFWRALHNGRSKDGRLLYPAFPYPNYSQISREDSNAIFRPPWLSGVRCTFARVRSNPRLRRLPSGTAVHIWCVGSVIALHATRPAIRSAQRTRNANLQVA